jgi:hypothetical protein
MKTHGAQFGYFAPAVALASVLLLTACGGGGDVSPPPVPLAIVTTSLPDAMTGQSYRQTLLATGGRPPYAWSVSSGSLPNGLSLDAVGVVSGIPTEVGDFRLSVQVKDYSQRTANREFTLHVVEGVSIVTSSLLDAWYNEPYAQTLAATGGSPPYTWSLAAGTLPAGLNLSVDGVISGTPVQVWGTYVFGVRVRDSGSFAATRELRITITTRMTIVSALVEGNLEAEYLGGIYVYGGIWPYTWSLAPGSSPLPPGLSLTGIGSTGEIRGTPTVQGTFNFTVQVSDSGSPTQVVTLDASIVIHNNLFIKLSVLPVGVRDWPYRESLLAAAGTRPYSWSLTGTGTVPPGLTLNPSGEVSGTPVQEGYFAFGVSVTDSGAPPQSVETNAYLTVNPPLGFVQTNLNDAVNGRSYYGYAWAVGGRPPFALQVTSGTLPPGLYLASSTSQWGSFPIYGTPTAVGAFSFAAELTDSSSPPASVSATLSIQVYSPLVGTTTSLPERLSDEPYSATLTAEGGRPPYRWGLLAYGEFPVPGLTLDASTGEIHGTPTAAYDDYLSFYVQDSASPPQIAYIYSLHLRIIGRLFITSSQLPPAVRNTLFRVAIGHKGGTAPYAWSITSGTLPNGLSLNSATGEIAGTPTIEGTSNFTVHVTDTGPPVQTTSRQLSLTITSSLGRNDSTATATPISNGRFRASISPYADPVSGPAYPDNDYYAVTANPGAVVRVETMAERLTPQSPLDTVIEIVDGDGNRLSTCRPYTWYPFTLPCLSDDDAEASTLDSRLEFKASDSASGPVTVYVRVLSWDGSARPDFIYDLSIFGAN